MLWSVVAVAVLAVVIFLLAVEQKNPLDDLPGFYKIPYMGEMFIFIREAVKKFGDRFVFKIFGRRILQITHPRDVEVVLSHSKNISKGKPYSFLKSWLGTGLLLSTGSKWHKRRKILTPTFHFNVLKTFVKIMSENSKSMLEYLSNTEGKEIDLMPVVSEFTLLTICDTAMGTQLSKDKSSITVEYKKAVLNIGETLCARLSRVWLHVDAIFRHSDLGKRYQKSLEIVHSFPDKVILERKASLTQSERDDITAAVEGEDLGNKRRLAMLDLLLEAERKGEIDLEGIREEVNTFMFEGHDTTAMAITFGLMLLADHENVQKRIFEECESILGDTGRSLTMSDLADMKYLEAVIKEILRLYPSVPFISRTVTEDFMLNDLLVKKGAEIGIHIYDLHRREDMFPESEVFNPDRFLQGELKHNFAFVPFSAGPRNCIGQRFAMLEMKSILSEVCHNFTLTRQQRGKQPALISDMVLRPAEPIYVKFIKRVK